jgi:hypothetical protein
LIYRLNKKGLLRRIKNDQYVFLPIGFGPQGRNISEYKIPGLLFPDGNYYIGYSSMYNYYKFTDRIFQVTYILNTKIQREMKMIKWGQTLMRHLTDWQPGPFSDRIFEDEVKKGAALIRHLTIILKN